MNSINVKDIPGKYLVVENEAARNQILQYATVGTLVSQNDNGKLYKAVNITYYNWWYEAHPGDPTYIYTDSPNPNVGDDTWWWRPLSGDPAPVLGVDGNRIRVGNYWWDRGSEEQDLSILGWEEVSSGVVAVKKMPEPTEDTTVLYIGDSTEKYKKGSIYHAELGNLYAYVEEGYEENPIYTYDEVITNGSSFYYFDSDELVKLDFISAEVGDGYVDILFSQGDDPIRFSRYPSSDIENYGVKWIEAISNTTSEARDTALAALALAEEASEGVTDAATAINIATNALENSKILEDQLPNAVGTYQLVCDVVEDQQTGELIKTLSWQSL